MSKTPEQSVISIDDTLSTNITELFKSVAVENVNEAITVLFHAYLLESGFLPKDVLEEDKYRCMPKDWNKNGVFNINYVHNCCSSFTSCVSYVFLYNNVSIHGIISEAACPDTVHIKINVKDYIKQRTNLSDVNNVFCNLEELSKHFKDDFCLPLLNLLHETTGGGRLFGMPGLIDELKLNILQLLPVESVVSMSGVNKSFNYLANSHFLWKYMFQRDYAKDGVPEISSETNWKQAYKSEYLKRKRKRRLPSMRFQRNVPPFLPSIYPDFGIHFDPPLPDFDLPYPSFDPPFPNIDPPFPNLDPSFFRPSFPHFLLRKW